MTKTPDTEKLVGYPRVVARQRPATVRPPDHWRTTSAPSPAEFAPRFAPEKTPARNPVRYGDWEYKGRAIDF